MKSVHDFAAMEQFRRQVRLDPHRMKRWRHAYYQRHLGDEATKELPPHCRDAFQQTFALHELSLVSCEHSQADGASRILLRTSGGSAVEAIVLRASTGRTTLCLSCQSGCAANCAFCATARMPRVYNLTAGEIVDQVIQAHELLRLEQRRIRNILFMGMGEPFHNEEQVGRAVELLCHAECFAYAPRRIVVSTVGIPEAMRRWMRCFPQVRLTLSLHSARQQVRERLIPLARRYPLDQLRETLAELVALTKAPALLEYLLLQGVTDTAEDVAAINGFCKGLPAHVNLIPYNPVPGLIGFAATERTHRDQFAAALRGHGIRVTFRHSMGGDIAAACGQLAGNQVSRRGLLG